MDQSNERTLDLFNQGMSRPDIAKAQGLSPKTISARLIKLTGKREQRHVKWTSGMDDEITQRYSAGQGIKRIGNALGVSPASTRDRLIKLGVFRQFIPNPPANADTLGSTHELKQAQAYESRYERWYASHYMERPTHEQQEEKRAQKNAKALADYYANHDENKRKANERAKANYYRKRGTPEYKVMALARRTTQRISRYAPRPGRPIHKRRTQRRSIELLGCTYQEAANHIEAQFEQGMSWENYGTRWEIDHIIPLASVDTSKDTELRQVCNYLNLRPLSVSKNRSRPKRFVTEPAQIPLGLTQLVA